MHVPVDTFQPADKMQGVPQFGQKGHIAQQPSLFRGNSGGADPSAYQWQARRTSVTQQLYLQQIKQQAAKQETTGAPTVSTFPNFLHNDGNSHQPFYGQKPFPGEKQAKKQETGASDPMQMQNEVEEVLTDYQEFKMSLSEKA